MVERSRRDRLNLNVIMKHGLVKLLVRLNWTLDSL